MDRHNVDSLEEPGPLINFWWREGEPLVFFSDNGDPVEHLLENARGILGKRTPELVARVKKMLIGVLSR